MPQGSVRREGNQIRINAQLIDGVNGHHLWAARYDSPFGGMFAFQDQGHRPDCSRAGDGAHGRRSQGLCAGPSPSFDHNERCRVRE